MFASHAGAVELCNLWGCCKVYTKGLMFRSSHVSYKVFSLDAITAK